MNPNELKSAEEWLKIQLTDKNPEFDKCKTELKRQALVMQFYKQIQLNAYKAGMTEAAEIFYNDFITKSRFPMRAAFEVKQSIITARDKKESL